MDIDSKVVRARMIHGYFTKFLRSNVQPPVADGLEEPEDSIETRQIDTGDDQGCLELLQFLHELTLTHSCASICRHHLAHKHMHTRAHTNLVFGRGAAAVLGQVQHGSVALKAGRAVEPVLKNQPHAYTQIHTHRHIHT